VSPFTAPESWLPCSQLNAVRTFTSYLSENHLIWFPYLRLVTASGLFPWGSPTKYFSYLLLSNPFYIPSPSHCPWFNNIRRRVQTAVRIWRHRDATPPSSYLTIPRWMHRMYRKWPWKTEHDRWTQNKVALSKRIYERCVSIFYAYGTLQGKLTFKCCVYLH
jgi:hypothetical protein